MQSDLGSHQADQWQIQE